MIGDIIRDILEDFRRIIIDNRLIASTLISADYLRIRPEVIHEDIIKRQLANEFAHAIKNRMQIKENELHNNTPLTYKNTHRYDAEYVMIKEQDFLLMLDKIETALNLIYSQP